MMRLGGIGAVALAAVVLWTVPAAADTRAGVEAWQRGDYAAAIAQWRPAAVAGDADAQFNMGQAYKLGHGVAVDPVQSEQWYRRAVAQGHQQAEDNLGLLLFQQGQRTQALPFLQHSADRGEPRAQLILGTMLYNGDGIPRDYPRAYALILRSTAQGLPQAAQVQAQMDQYIPAADRQRGVALARQYESAQQRPQLPPEIASAPGSPRGLPPAPAPIVTAPPPARTSAATPPAAAPTRTTPPVVANQEPAPRPVSVSGRGWKVQLGAFRDEGNARRLFDSLSGRVSALAGSQPIFVRAGALTRLQVGPYASSAEATRVCAAVRPTGTPCVPVAP